MMSRGGRQEEGYPRRELHRVHTSGTPLEHLCRNRRAKYIYHLSRQIGGDDVTALEMDIQQNPEMWANARRQSRENSIAAAHVALKHGHLTKGGLRAHTFMEKMLGSKLGADTVENMSSETFRIEAEVLRQEYTKTQAISWVMSDVENATPHINVTQELRTLKSKKFGMPDLEVQPLTSSTSTLRKSSEHSKQGNSVCRVLKRQPLASLTKSSNKTSEKDLRSRGRWAATLAALIVWKRCTKPEHEIDRISTWTYWSEMRRKTKD